MKEAAGSLDAVYPRPKERHPRPNFETSGFQIDLSRSRWDPGG